MSRVKLCRWLLLVHFVVALVAAVPLLFFLGRAADWVNWGTHQDWTSLKVLGAAILALGVGSLLAYRDPVRYRIMVQTEILFTFVAALGLLYRLLFKGNGTPDFAWVVFGVLAAFCVGFSVLYPPKQHE